MVSINELMDKEKTLSIIQILLTSTFFKCLLVSLGSLYFRAGLCKFSEIWHLYQLYFVFLHGIMLCILLLKYCRKPIND